MRRHISSFASVLVVLVCATSVEAQVLFSDGFESYTAGGNPLDKNVAGPNAAPNGSGNPWFGPAPPNARVVGPDSTNGPTVNPHGGNNMIRGSAPSDLDQNWYNLAYRLNSGSAFSGNIEFDWYFYDPFGQGTGSTNFRDYAAVGFYNTAPGGTDYPGTGSLNTGVTQIQRLGLGAFNGNAASQTVYNARIVGETAGNAGNAAWFLTGVARSVGWHKGTIKIGPALGDNTNDVEFYVDDIFALGRNSKTAFGYNVLEFNTNFGSTTGYFDDVTFSAIPEPIAITLLLLAPCLSRRRRGHLTTDFTAGGRFDPGVAVDETHVAAALAHDLDVHHVALDMFYDALALTHVLKYSNERRGDVVDRYQRSGVIGN